MIGFFFFRILKNKFFYDIISKLNSIHLVFRMKVLLKLFNLSDEAISVYLEGLGKFPYTFSEIHSLVPKASEKEVKQIINELIEKKLILLVNPKYLDSLPHYIHIPPFAAILNSITELTDVSEEASNEESNNNLMLERCQENLYKDLETIIGDLIDLLSNKDNSGQTMEILSEVEENVKKLAHMILNDVIGMISPLRMQSAVDARDFSKLINSVKNKISESEETVANMFTQFRDIVKDLGSSKTPAEVETFKIFIRKLGESIDKRVQELSLGTGSPTSEKIQVIEKSLYDILANYISINKVSSNKFWIINSYEKIKEILSQLLDKCKNELTIIVPNIEDFIPLEKLELVYSEDLGLEKGNIQINKKEQKKLVYSGTSITKKQKKEIAEKFDITAKKVAELKGFELSHDIAELLTIISDVNAESVVIDGIQGWLNRLLVIRKHLDSNTQYLLLEDLEKWKKEYPKVKIIEKKPEKEIIDELISDKDVHVRGLKIKIISSDPHENKHVLAFHKKLNIEYLQIKKNNNFIIFGDNCYLVFGTYQKIKSEDILEICGFFTTYKPIIDLIIPLISELRGKAKFPKEIEINRGFNEIIEKINVYSGKKIGKILKNLLDVAFEKDGISLDILELKLLIGKLEKIYQPLNNVMKEYVINEINKLNKKFSSLELIYPPEFESPILEEEVRSELEIEKLPSQIEPLDPDKIDNLFEILLEKIDELKGVEIGEQIDKFIEIILKLQGYPNIIEWKNSLSTVNEILEEPFKEKIKEDLLSWKLGILQQNTATSISIKEDIAESHGYSTHEIISSIFDENYVSPGLGQSQYGAEEEPSCSEDVNKLDPKTDIKELFNKIQTNLNDLSGAEISNLMQNIIDIILETEGYSMALKSAKDWISTLRKVKKPLESELKDDFQLELLKWKEKYSNGDDDTNLDFKPSFEIVEESRGVNGKGNGGCLNERFNNLIQNALTFKGDKLSQDLQNVADIVLESHGAVAVNVIRQWISKLRSLKEPLGDEIKDEFLTELENWKEKYV